MNLLAFDFGASSGRAVLGTFEKNLLNIKEIHRFPNGMMPLFGRLHWNIIGLYQEILKGLGAYSKKYGKHLDGVGIDTWGVDFALTGKDDMLLGPPYAYRDKLTDSAMEKVFKTIPKKRIYEITGIQFMKFNSLFQLFALAESHSPYLEAAENLLTIPDFLNFLLTGEKACEFSIATTTQLYDPNEKDWAGELFETLNLPAGLMQKIVPTGTVIGSLLPDIAYKTDLAPVPVIAPACHDTGSAVAAVPAKGKDWAYLSSGTWSLMGIESETPIITDESARKNFTNEGGVNNSIRFLKNICGLWLIQECRRLWERAGESLSYEEIATLAKDARPFRALIDPDHPMFISPENMLEAIVKFCKKTGQTPPESKSEFSRCIFESLAFKYKFTLNNLESLRGRPFEVLHIVGGGANNELLCQLTANAVGIPVVAGPSEATSVGNIIVQAMAKGFIGSIDEGRAIIKDSFEIKTYEPEDCDDWDEFYEYYQNVQTLGTKLK